MARDHKFDRGHENDANIQPKCLPNQQTDLALFPYKPKALLSALLLCAIAKNPNHLLLQRSILPRCFTQPLAVLDQIPRQLPSRSLRAHNAIQHRMRLFLRLLDLSFHALCCFLGGLTLTLCFLHALFMRVFQILPHHFGTPFLVGHFLCTKCLQGIRVFFCSLCPCLLLVQPCLEPKKSVTKCAQLSHRSCLVQAQHFEDHVVRIAGRARVSGAVVVVIIDGLWIVAGTGFCTGI